MDPRYRSILTRARAARIRRLVADRHSPAIADRHPSVRLDISYLISDWLESGGLERASEADLAYL